MVHRPPVDPRIHSAPAVVQVKKRRGGHETPKVPLEEGQEEQGAGEQEDEEGDREDGKEDNDNKMAVDPKSPRAELPIVQVCPDIVYETLIDTEHLGSMWSATLKRCTVTNKPIARGGTFWTKPSVCQLTWTDVADKHKKCMRRTCSYLNDVLANGVIDALLPDEVHGWEVGALSLMETPEGEGKPHTDDPLAGEAFLFISMWQKEPYQVHFTRVGKHHDGELPRDGHKYTMHMPHSKCMYVVHGLTHTNLQHRHESKHLKIGLRVGLFRRKPQSPIPDLQDLTTGENDTASTSSSSSSSSKGRGTTSSSSSSSSKG